MLLNEYRFWLLGLLEGVTFTACSDSASSLTACFIFNSGTFGRRRVDFDRMFRFGSRFRFMFRFRFRFRFPIFIEGDFWCQVFVEKALYPLGRTSRRMTLGTIPTKAGWQLSGAWCDPRQVNANGLVKYTLSAVMSGSSCVIMRWSRLFPHLS